MCISSKSRKTEGPYYLRLKVLDKVFTSAMMVFFHMVKIMTVIICTNFSAKLSEYNLSSYVFSNTKTSSLHWWRLQVIITHIFQPFSVSQVATYTK